MTFPKLSLLAAAALAVCLGQSAVAAAPAANHPAVQRALAHLGGSAAAAARSGPADAFEASDLVVDPDGAEHVRFQRTHGGLPVIGGDLVVHSHATGSFSGVSQTMARPVAISLTPKLSGDAAAHFALRQFGHLGGKLGSRQLVVYARGETPALAWNIAVNGVQSDGTPSEAHLIVDAHSAKLLDRWDDIHTADAVGTGVTLYSGTVPLHAKPNKKSTSFQLLDATRGGHFVVNMNNGTGTETNFKGKDNVWGSGVKTDPETAAADADYGQNTTWDYYTNVHGRNGIANDGKGARSRVHYSSAYDNAFWSDSCFCMTYGDGNVFNPLVSLDVAGHEMTHGVTSRTAGLIYSGESGGLNEATSDIFGSMVEYYANNANDVGDYLIGEEISKTAGKALRYMYSPNTDGASSDCYFTGVGNIDVHYSSGVANHFYYMLAEGTAPVDGPASPTCKGKDTRKASGTGTVVGIGRQKAEKIWYRALTIYMTSSETFAKARLDTVQAATDLFGAGSPETTAVGAAWDAVNRP
jgi:Zn-dependent metalloprotease